MSIGQLPGADLQGILSGAVFRRMWDDIRPERRRAGTRVRISIFALAVPRSTKWPNSERLRAVRRCTAASHIRRSRTRRFSSWKQILSVAKAGGIERSGAHVRSDARRDSFGPAELENVERSHSPQHSGGGQTMGPVIRCRPSRRACEGRPRRRFQVYRCVQAEKVVSRVSVDRRRVDTTSIRPARSPP